MNATFLGNVSYMANSTVIQDTEPIVSYAIPWNTIAKTSISLFGVITNLVCFIVFMSSSIKDQTYTCMMVNCLVDLVYLLIQLLAIFLSCGALCAAWTSSIVGRVYTLYLIYYFSGCLAFYNILIFIYISILRCLLILNKKFLSRIPCKYILTSLFLVIMILNSQNLFAMYIVERTKSDGSVIYTLGFTQFARTSAYKAISQANKIVRIVLVIGILPAINFILAFLFRRHLDKKKQLTRAALIYRLKIRTKVTPIFNMYSGFYFFFLISLYI